MEKKIILIRYHDKAGENTRLPDSLNKVQGVLPPLGIAALAATLEEANIPVEIIDCQGSNLNKDEFEQLIKDKKPMMVGIGPMMTPSIEGIYEAAAICKKYGCIVIVGGPHLSIYPKETLMNPNIDYGINGEGDLVIVDLVNGLLEGKDVTEIYSREITRAILMITTTLAIVSFILWSIFGQTGMIVALPFILFIIFRYFYIIDKKPKIARHPHKMISDKQIMIAVGLLGLIMFGVLYVF